MKLVQPAQIYSTVIFDRYQKQSVSFHFVPVRCFDTNLTPPLDVIARNLDAKLQNTPEIMPWFLPALLASLLVDPNESPINPSYLLEQWAAGGSLVIAPHKLGFAEYVTFADAIPFEESAPKGKSLMAIATMAGFEIGLVLGQFGPLIIVTVPLGIVLCTAAAEFGPQLGKRLAALIGFP